MDPSSFAVDADLPFIKQPHRHGLTHYYLLLSLLAGLPLLFSSASSLLDIAVLPHLSLLVSLLGI